MRRPTRAFAAGLVYVNQSKDVAENSDNNLDLLGICQHVLLKVAFSPIRTISHVRDQIYTCSSLNQLGQVVLYKITKLII